MKATILKRVLWFLSVWFIVSVAVGGCHCVVNTYNVSKPKAVYASKAPPHLKSETKSRRPSAKHIWIDGSWKWNEAQNEWEWSSGQWLVPPKGYVWAPPSYDVRDVETVIYMAGHWEETKALKAEKARKERSRKAAQKREKQRKAAKKTSNKETTDGKSAGSVLKRRGKTSSKKKNDDKSAPNTQKSK